MQQSRVDDERPLTACLAAPTLGVLEAADHFAVCAEAMSHNDRAGVLAALARVDTEALAQYWVAANAQWYVRQKGAPGVTRAALPRQRRKTLPKETKRRLAERDGWRCRYCGVRMLAKDFCWALNNLVDDTFCVSGLEAQLHPAALSLRYTQDHVVPVSRGATNELDELVASCWTCNFAKGDRTLAELGLLDPRDRPPVVDDWDGLVGRFGRPEY